MGAMYRLKAYFGMVPAEELAEYADDAERYLSPRATGYDNPHHGDRWDRWEDHDSARLDRYDSGHRSDHRSADQPVVDRYADRRDSAPDRYPARPSTERVALPPMFAGSSEVPVRGSLAIDAGMLGDPPAVPATLPEPRERLLGGAAALARITTLQPGSYNEARTIGERYRDGVPVIMNLTDLDDAAAKRLVDFAAGLAFALRGSIDKVTNRVFLLTPADVEVSADDARKLVGRVGALGAERSRFASP